MMTNIPQDVIDDINKVGFELTDDINYYAANTEQLFKFCQLRDARQADNKKQVQIVAKVIKNSAGQITMQDGEGNSFDMSKYVGQTFYTAPPDYYDALEQAAKLCEDNAKELREFAEPFGANIAESLAKDIRKLIPTQPTQGQSECPYCTSDNQAIKDTYFNQCCEGCVKRMSAPTPDNRSE
jgi:hypothetical protein